MPRRRLSQRAARFKPGRSASCCASTGSCSWTRREQSELEKRPSKRSEVRSVTRASSFRLTSRFRNCTLEPHDEAAGSDHVMNPWAWCRKREVTRARVYVPQLSAKSQPPEPSHVDSSAKLKGARIRVALIRIQAAIGFQLGF